MSTKYPSNGRKACCKSRVHALEQSPERAPDPESDDESQGQLNPSHKVRVTEYESDVDENHEKFPLISNTDADRKDVFTEVVQPVLAEFICVTFFVFIGTMATQDNLILGVALAHGLTIAILVISFGKISGGHMNPVVTLGVMIGGGIKPVLVPLYMTAQLLGSILGAVCTRGCLSYTPTTMGSTNYTETVYESILGGTQSMGAGVSVANGFLTEVLLTCLLLTVVLHSAVDTHSASPVHGLAIGFTVAVCIVAGGKTSGASMNPARAFGPAVVFSDMGSAQWTNHWIYWVGPFMGAIIAAIIYRCLTAANDRRILFKDKNQ